MGRYLLRSLKWFALAIVIVLVVAVTGVYLIYGWPAQGKDALALMTQEQKQFATTVLPTIAPTANVAQISKLLGEPIENGVARVKWAGPIRPDNTRINAYFLNGRIAKITYLSIDPFWGWTLYDREGKLLPAS